MPRFFVAAVLAIAAALPATAFALGLGEIDLSSALNQPFNAEIPVTSETSDSISGLKVKLASADTFERYGLERPAFLTDLDFKVVTEHGRTVIRITSQQPVVEPFVTMLLDVSWPQGRLLREYTVLLDPPVFDSVVAPAASPAAAAAASARPAPSSSRPPAPVSRAASAARVPASRAGADSGTDSYGPVAPNETLWRIAQRVRPGADVDINQMMLAIYRANPQAFAGNINRLQAGAILRVPNAEQVRNISRAEALAEVRRQNEIWRGRKTPAGQASARLRLVPPPAEAEAGVQESGAAGKATASAGASADTSERVKALETELAERDRLLELRDKELAELQNQLEQLRQRTGAAAEPEAPAGSKPAEPAGAPSVAEAPGQPPETAVVQSETQPEVQAEAEPEAAVPGAVSTVKTPQEEPSFLSRLFGSWYVYAGIAVAFLLALFVARSRRPSEEEPTGRWDEVLDEQDSELAPTGDTARLTPTQAADETFVVEETPGLDTDQLSGTAADRSADHETALEKTLSSDVALNLDQADPIAEAEFHMAYGLFDQAADLLTEALKTEPERRDLRHKLLDVYFVWENKGGFLREAQVFHDQVGDDDPEWNKILIMGKQLCPGEELFAAAPAAVDSGEEMDLALDFDTGDADVDLQLGDDSAQASDEVDLDLSAIQPGPAAEDEGLDFDLGDATVGEADLSPTELDQGGASTLETPTVEAPGPDSPTVETPTIEQAGPDSPTVETPTIEQAGPDSPTVETPTIETAAMEGDTEGGDETAALDLDELGLDLDEFADLGEDGDFGEEEDQSGADDAATVLAEDLGDETLLKELGEGLEATSEMEALDALAGGEEDTAGSDATAELQSLDSGADEEDAGLAALTAAMESSLPGEGREGTGDTVEQPRPDVEETAEQPRPQTADGADDVTEELLSGSELGVVDLEIGEAPQLDDTPTGTMTGSEPRPEGPTMTEVGTKLDLARAYVDMGDPEGAKSILDEVIEEGDDSQRQEAQQMLDQLSR